MLVALALLAGCGFRPLYGNLGREAGSESVAEAMARIEIAPIPDRIGQQVRNGLLDALVTRGTTEKPEFVLRVRLTEGTSDLAVQKTAFATRAILTVNADFQLVDISTGASIVSSNSHATASLNILKSEFATLMAEKNARQRAIKQVVDDIRLKIATALERRS
ncbi:MAG: LPS assembly lipoprotein LptE [Rhodospirillaceae bacterium]